MKLTLEGSIFLLDRAIDLKCCVCSWCKSAYKPLKHFAQKLWFHRLWCCQRSAQSLASEVHVLSDHEAKILSSGQMYFVRPWLFSLHEIICNLFIPETASMSDPETCSSGLLELFGTILFCAGASDEFASDLHVARHIWGETVCSRNHGLTWKENMNIERICT
jgi:hypothetical protein